MIKSSVYSYELRAKSLAYRDVEEDENCRVLATSVWGDGAPDAKSPSMALDQFWIALVWFLELLYERGEAVTRYRDPEGQDGSAWPRLRGGTVAKATARKVVGLSDLKM